MLMRFFIRLVFVFIALQQAAPGEIYKCTNEQGVIEFTDESCPNGITEIINIEERYTTDLPGLRPYELERLQQLDYNLQLEKLARLDARQALAALTASDEVLCRSALLHVDDLQYRLYSGQAGYNSRFLRDHLSEQLLKRDKYCQ